MIKLGHKIIGSGEKKVLFLHELMGSHKNYDSIHPYLDTENFTYIFIDHRGYGLSKDIKGDYTIEEASNDIKNLISILNIDEVYLVAHSMSTMIAQRIALIDEKIKQLILITPISAGGVKVSELQKQSLLKQNKEDENFIEEVVYSSSKRYNQAWADYRIQMGYESSIVDARVGYMNMYLNNDFKKEAEENIAIPIKIIIGKNDFPVFGKNQVMRNFSNYKNIEIIECQEAGHYPMIECPVFFASKIEEFCS